MPFIVDSYLAWKKLGLYFVKEARLAQETSTNFVDDRLIAGFLIWLEAASSAAEDPGACLLCSNMVQMHDMMDRKNECMESRKDKSTMAFDRDVSLWVIGAAPRVA